MAKKSKSKLSKAGRTLAKKSSTKAQKKNAGKTLGEA